MTDGDLYDGVILRSVPTRSSCPARRPVRNELVVSVQARDWLVGTLDGEFDVDAVTADPRHDTRNHPIDKPDIGLARAR
ncbi:MAG: hypothetical protein ACLP5J_01150, partial [Mycobacterium sp.]|uniref:hypothetical protein n=1 Tax=Mycobacterium sp. TaxID=1785 RepID=UPI003F978B1C